MNTLTCHGTTIVGITAHLVAVELFSSRGLPGIHLVGLPDATVSEARERVRTALQASQLPIKQSRYTINLSPAALPKTGANLDLAIATVLLASQYSQLCHRLDELLCLGELSLSGQVRAIRGTLASVMRARDSGLNYALVPVENYAEASLVEGITIIPIGELADVYDFVVKGRMPRSLGRLNEGQGTAAAAPSVVPKPQSIDFKDIVGQAEAKAALEVAAAGRHHLLMSGPPGVGKTMLASALPGILPPLSRSEALQTTAIASLALPAGSVTALQMQPPLQTPHHSASPTALVGGGSRGIVPGAITHAHLGVLFLDEAPEFAPKVLQLLRQPLESGLITLHRTSNVLTLPADFLLLLAANPCPCGYWGDTTHACTCSPHQQRRYQNRLSGPLLDRIDLRVSLYRQQYLHTDHSETSQEVRARVQDARERQQSRFTGQSWSTNAHAPGTWLRAHTPQPVLQLLRQGLESGVLSQREVDKIFRVSWTLADLAGLAAPTVDHAVQAMTWRNRTVVG